jgi:diguanylate cyclase (GGDEF)-like protein
MDKRVNPIRVLVADDEASVIEAYRHILDCAEDSDESGPQALDSLRYKLFGSERAHPASHPSPHVFDVTFAQGAQEAVAAVRKAAERNRPFRVAFLDMRMPPGPDGAWAAAQIRSIDPRLDIVIASAYSDIDPRDMALRVPPSHKIFYLQKPFHPFEVRQLAIALGQKSQAESMLYHLAFFDALTGLPNRAHFFRVCLKQAIELAKRQGWQMALLFLDLDNFKHINESLGHSIGDQLLRAVSDRLTRCIRSSDLTVRVPSGDPSENIARLGGDEFIILLSRIKAPSEAAIAATRIRALFSEPFRLEGNELTTSASIGISVYPHDGKDVETLLKSAEMAMYDAKRIGRNVFQYFTKAMDEAAMRRLTVEGLLRKALGKKEFFLLYQPQIDLSTMAPCGMEALLRWNSLSLGIMPPNLFITIAEESGLIVSIGEWVLRTACTQARTWIKQGLPLSRIAVNISTLQFVQAGFTDLVARVLAETGLPPSLLELEITESLLMKDEENAVHTLKALKALGIQIAIDDFGTGYSSLSRLKRFPIDRIKIDRSFIRSITTDMEDQAIATAIISMGYSMNLKVIAEGVETDSQLCFLKERRCHEVQGFLFAKPLSQDAAEAFLLQGSIPEKSSPLCAGDR